MIAIIFCLILFLEMLELHINLPYKLSDLPRWNRWKSTEQNELIHWVCLDFQLQNSDKMDLIQNRLLPVLWHQFLDPRPLQGLAMATHGRIVEKWCHLELIKEKRALHLGHQFDSPGGKSHRKPMKVGARKTHKNKGDGPTPSEVAQLGSHM